MGSNTRCAEDLQADVGLADLSLISTAAEVLQS